MPNVRPTALDEHLEDLLEDGREALVEKRQRAEQEEWMAGILEKEAMAELRRDERGTGRIPNSAGQGMG